MSDLPLLRAPVFQITANPMTTGTSSKSQSKLHIGVITGGAIGGIAALVAIGAVALMVRHQRNRRLRRQSVGSSFETVTAPDWSMTVIPFNQTHIGVAGLESGSQMNSQRRWAEPVRPESIPLVQAPPLKSPMTSPCVVSFDSFPVGLSGKELARLRADSLGSQSNDPWSSGLTLAATTELSGTASTLEAQRHRSEVECLGIVQQPRSEAPPDYEDRGT
jgi:hypothetical protein